MFEKYTHELTVSQDESQAADGWAFGQGTYQLKLTPKGRGKEIEDAGKWLNLIQRQPDGSWKIARHIWNSDKPGM